MARVTAFDEFFVHQIPQFLPTVERQHPHWRESYFFEFHDPESINGDAVFFTCGNYPQHGLMDSLQMGRVDGVHKRSRRDRAHGDDPHTTQMPGMRIDVVEPWKEVRLWADPEVCDIGIDAVFRARTQPYGLRRGTMRAGNEVIWDQCHILQSGVYSGTYTSGGKTYSIDNWVGQRDHSWGIRDHGRCPLWLWFQIQLEDGFLAVWHWELANGAHIYTDGCWAGADGSDPIPVVRFEHDVNWTGRYGQNGESASGVSGRCRFVLENGKEFVVDAEGTFACPYEPHRRGGLNVVQVSTADGRQGHGIYEITGARHHKFFPETVVEGILPS